MLGLLMHVVEPFRAPGEAVNLKGSGVLLPGAAEAVPFVEQLRGERLLRRGPTVRARQLRFKGSHQAVFGALYVVKIGELAELLFRIGDALSPSLSDLRPEAGNPPTVSNPSANLSQETGA